MSFSRWSVFSQHTHFTFGWHLDFSNSMILLPLLNRAHTHWLGKKFRKVPDVADRWCCPWKKATSIKDEMGHAADCCLTLPNSHTWILFSLISSTLNGAVFLSGQTTKGKININSENIPVQNLKCGKEAVMASFFPHESHCDPFSVGPNWERERKR